MDLIKFRHYSGVFYYAYPNTFRHTNDDCELMVYFDDCGNKFATPVDDFHDWVSVDGKRVKRFEVVAY